MAGYSVDEVFGAGTPVMRVSAEEQARRNADAAVILQRERETARPEDLPEIDARLAKMTAADPFLKTGGDPIKIGAVKTPGELLTHDGYPAKQNKDGSYSTELSITVTDPRLNGGKPTNIPSLWKGQVVDEDTAVKNAIKAGKPYASYSSIDEAVSAAKARSAAGGAGASVEVGFTPEEAFGPVSKGFVEGFKEKIRDPFTNIKYGMVGNLRRAAQAGTFNKTLGEIFQSVPDTIKHFSFGDFVGEVKRDPGGAAAGFLNSLMGDPEQLLIPLGIGGSVARAGGRVAGAAGRVAGRAVEGAAVGAPLNTAIAASEQLDKTGKIDVRALAEPAEAGAAFGALFGSVLGRGGKAAEKPRAAPEVERRVQEPEAAAQKILEDYQREVLKREPAEPLKPVENPLPPVVPDEITPAVKATLETPEFKEALDILQKPAKERTSAEAAALEKWKMQTAMIGGAVAGLAGLAIADPDRAKEIGLLGAAIGAVKPKGGIWHSGAIERLAAPLKDRLLPDGQEVGRILAREHPAIFTPDGYAKDIKEGQRLVDAYLAPTETFIDRAVRNYLNKHAGTESDPLKDIELATTDKTWGQAFDNLIKARTVAETKGREMGLKEGETGYIIAGRATQPEEYAAITSQLSHVGDYLRQNVPPDKLPQYDLVRAVKETAKRDAEVAKQMDRAAADSTKDLPVYKDYGDGMKWVELKLGDEGKEVKGVRLSTQEEWKHFAKLADEQGGYLDADAPPGERMYVAVDSNNKPILNSYTNMPALGATPHKARLAGDLANEGNQMGHCVGGYCEGVAFGESRIFSLRDAKGRSHVTIEVEPKSIRSWGNVTPQGLLEAGVLSSAELARLPAALRNQPAGATSSAHALTEALGFGEITTENIIKAQQELSRRAEKQAALRDPYPADIVQIKGKQNRAPNAEYLPYVQDFVRGGKWGEVGDLRNAGLRDTSRDPFSPEQKADFIREFGEDSRYVTEDAFRDWYARKGWLGGSQRGSVSSDLLIRLGLGATGAATFAALNDENPFYGALAGGLAGAFAPSMGGFARSALKGADRMLGMVSTRIANIDPALRFKTVDLERRVLTDTSKYLDAVEPFLGAVRALKGESAKEMNLALLNNDASGILKALIKIDDPKLAASYASVRDVLDVLGNQLQTANRIKKQRADYFPRRVADYEGLRATLDLDTRKGLDKALADAEAKAMKETGMPLSRDDQSRIIMQYLRQPTTISGQPQFAKPRRVEEVTEQLEPFYEKPADSLIRYIRESVEDIERSKFFGRQLATKEKGGATYIDMEASIGNVVAEALEKGRIQPAQVRELQELLHDRFATRESPKFVQDIRNLGNMGLLGNVVSASTQLGDLATAAYAQGLRPSLGAVVQLLAQKHRISTADFGIANRVGEEFSSTSRTARWLNNMFKYSMFSAVDQLGKNVNLNAALSRFEKLAKSEKGVKQIETKYGDVFGNEMPSLLDDLARRDVTDRVKSLLFAELSDVQPITRLEVPQAYLNMPGGRIIYWLKSYMLKQADIVRRDAYNEIKKGTLEGVRTGVGNLTKYGLYLGIAGATTNAIQDWIMGRDVKLSASDVWLNAIKTFGFSEYMLEQAKTSPAKAIAGVVAPPYRMFDDLLKSDGSAVKYLPVVGKLIYERFMGGAEKADIRTARTKEEKDDAKERYRTKIGEDAYEAEKERRRAKRLARELERQP